MGRTRSWFRIAIIGTLLAGTAAALGAATLESAQAAAAPLSCTSTRGAFVPKRAIISHIGTVQVISVGKTSTGAMGAPPLTDRGKHQLAWYKDAARPGSGRGGVAVDAHSWPDGSALGNHLYQSLVKGDTVILTDAGNRHRTCYRVTGRRQYASTAVPMSRLVRGSGKGQTLSIVVCSGVRLGPGDWTQRTVWTARAVPPPQPKPAPAPAPTPAPSGGLLGGLLGGFHP